MVQYASLDTEFLPNNLTPSGLISIGITTRHASYYAVNADMNAFQVCQREWMVENVWKHLPNHGVGYLDYDHEDVKDYGTIREEVDAFFRGMAIEPDRDITDYTTMLVNHGAQDVVRLHTLWDNDWKVMPAHIPTYADDVARIKRDLRRSEGGCELAMSLPVQDPETLHHALYDAEHELAVCEYIRKHWVTP
ncbi:3'-5' exoribonuclease [Streptomyces sp. 5-10]|uniref:3'-5' exoribonuclease n=1 Tax=Streptomyces sp. 5-10 TaxID=878925 RepID=UPI00168AA0B3|nr:3'-5' exoribonuclease [Streptomyces sp. 5-10]MBD3004870.1 3'-5' exoribonuclease [Streptomyces sp. 5-10]